MSDEVAKPLNSIEKRRLDMERATKVAFEDEASRRAADAEKSARLRALRLAAERNYLP
jgi:hypothetical protein